MLHAGLDLSRRKIDVCLLSESGEQVDQLVAAPDADALRTLARRIGEVYGEPVCAVVESMTGARLVHDTLEQEGWDVEIADAQKVKGLGAAGLQDRQDRLARAGAVEPARPGAGDLAARSWRSGSTQWRCAAILRTTSGFGHSSTVWALADFWCPNPPISPRIRLGTRRDSSVSNGSS